MKELESAREEFEANSMQFISMAETLEELDPRKLTTDDVKDVFVKMSKMLRSIANGELGKIDRMHALEKVFDEQNRQIADLRQELSQRGPDESLPV